jgi:hypothetical protein
MTQKNAKSIGQVMLLLAVALILGYRSPSKIAVMLGNCSIPCLFGKSLQDASYDDLKTFLEDAERLRNTQITFESDRISWQWSDEVVSKWAEINEIVFRENVFYSYRVVFIQSFATITAEYGNDFVIYPYYYAGRYTPYAMEYEQFNGAIFEILLSCDFPQVQPDTLIIAFGYPKRSTTNLKPATPIHWTGYDTQLPGCEAFRTIP